MTGRNPPDSVSANIQGDVTGQVAVGSYILQVGPVHGGIVSITAPSEQPQPRARTSPVLLRPRPIRGWLDRQAELETSLIGIRSGVAVEVSGESGVGKSAFLRHLAHSHDASSFQHGVIYLSARQRPLDDILQSLFDAFYECPAPFKATPAQLHLALQHRKALLLLDDVELARNELERVLDAAPECAVVIASRERVLWGEVQSILLRGLPAVDALTLLERELGRTVPLEDHPAALALCAALSGHPMRLLQAAALAREQQLPLADVLRSVEAAQTPGALTAQLLQSRDEKERRVLVALAAVGGAGLPADAIAALPDLPDLPDLEATLRGLARRRLIDVTRDRYVPAPGVAEAAQESLGRDPWEDRAIDSYAVWADRHRHEPAILIEESAALLRAHESAAATGRWKHVLRLGGLVGSALVLDGQWAAWGAVLKRNLDAARAIGNKDAEALALHEAGTRALCLGETTTAQQLLTEAMTLREALGDAAGAAVSRHNVGLIAPIVAPADDSFEPSSEGEPDSPADSVAFREGEPIDAIVVTPTTSTPFLPMALVLLGLIGVGGLGWWLGRDTGQPPVAGPARIVRFEARPAAIDQGEPAELCYEVADAIAAQVDQAVGPLSIVGSRCVPVQPSRTTTYTLVATDREGRGVEQRTTLVVSNGSVTPQPTIALMPAEVQFGLQVVRTPAEPRSLLLTNAGGETLAISRVALSGPEAGDFSVRDERCRTQLAGGDSCRIAVTFTPSAEGTRTAILTIDGEKADARWTARLTGAGAPQARPLASLPDALAFGSRTVKTAGESRAVVVSSRGSAALRMGGAQVAGDHAGDFHIVGDGCSGTELPRGADCAIEIRFVPSAPGQRSARLTVSDSSEGGSHLVALSGEGTAAPTPEARLMPATMEFQPQVVRQAGAPQIVRVTNTGNGPLVVERISVQGLHASDFQIRGNTCEGASLIASASCAIEIVFVPVGAGPRAATLAVTHNAGETPRDVALLGTALTPPRPVARVQPGQVDFGRQLVERGASGPRPISITNVGGTTLRVDRIGIGGEHARDFSIDNRCTGVSLERGQECSVVIRFSPGGPGPRRAQLVLADNSGEPAQRVALAGIGDLLGRLDLQPLRVDFGARQLRTSSPPQPVTVKNGGTVSLTLERIGVTGAHPSDFIVRRACDDATLAGGETCDVEVRFTPSAPGARTAVLVVAAADGGVREVSLTGSGEGVGRLEVTPASVDFGVQAIRVATGTRTIRVENNGTAPVTLGVVSMEGSHSRDFRIDTAQACTRATLEPRESCSIDVRFAPTAEAARTATLVIAEASGTSHSIALAGTGRAITPPPAGDLQIAPDRIDFGRVNLREDSQPQRVTLVNVGDGSLAIDRMVVTGTQAEDFVVRDRSRCEGSNLRGGQRCEIEILFVPRGAGARAAVLRVVDAAQGSLKQVVLTGSGVASAPIVRLDPDRIDFGTQSIVTSAAERIARAQEPGVTASRNITVLNPGQTEVVIADITLEGANPNDFILAGADACRRLGPGQRCAFRVTFRPTATGVRRAAAVVAHNASGSPRQVPLSGDGLRDKGGSGDGGNDSRDRCADLAVREIEFAVTRRTGQFEGVIRITGTVRNLGPGVLAPSFEARALLYEDAKVVRRQPLGAISPGQEISVSYERRWNSSSASEGEFPPRYRIEVDATADCNNGNNRTERNGADINRLFPGANGPDRSAGKRDPRGGQNGPATRPAEIVRFFAIDDKPGQRPSVCYLVTGATSGRIDPEVGPVKLSNQQLCISVGPTRTTNYVLTVQGADGRSVRRSVTVQVPERGITRPPIPVRPGVRPPAGNRD